MFKFVGLVVAISFVADVAEGGCSGGSGKEVLTYDNEYNEALKPPIKRVVRDVQTKRVECLEAYITKADVTRGGTGTTPKTRAYAQAMGLPGDQAGHLVANILGGTGQRTYNIVPQSRASNTGSDWRTTVERNTRNKIRDQNVDATFIVEPLYDQNNPTRPNKLKYSVTFTDNTSESGTVDNPAP